MSYQVLARKWRPRNFAEMVGQTHVLRAITNALDQQRLHHAYLFTGTRGVGKTTIARILAKSLNCEQGISSTPCGECTACREISEGRFIDLIEVDAASRTRVEDTRELLDNVQYTPTRARFKVYLIDEVHMLSGHSFNALLKTLEEPPPHVKFLLATTDPQKLPATVLSRCLQFNLKRMPAEQIAAHLEHILREESVEYETQAIHHLSHAADGSMRDALSLLDQAIAYGKGRLAVADVASMLGCVPRDSIYAILNALNEHDAAAMLRHVQDLDEHAPDYTVVLDEMLLLLYQLALVRRVPQTHEIFPDHERLLQSSKSFSEEDLQLYYQIALTGKRDLTLAPTPRSGFEMILLRMLAFIPGSRKTAPSSLAEKNRVEPSVQASEEKSKTGSPLTKSVSVSAPVSSSTLLSGGDQWMQMIAEMKLKGMLLQLAANCALKERQSGLVTLTLSGEHAQLYNKSFEERLQMALSDYLAEPVKLRIEIGIPAVETPAKQVARVEEEKRQAAIQHIEEDAFVIALKEQFGAEVQIDATQPLE